MTTPSQHAPTEAWVSPYITVVDVDAAVGFYKNAFQFTVSEVKSGEDGRSLHAEMSHNNQMIMCGKENAYGSSLKSPQTTGIESPITLCVSCEDVDDFYQKALSHGAKSISVPEDMFYGYRMCRLQDLDNYTWCFMKQLAF